MERMRLNENFNADLYWPGFSSEHKQLETEVPIAEPVSRGVYTRAIARRRCIFCRDKQLLEAVVTAEPTTI